ncbi:MAG TPA: bifunctional ADP-dependent NAD(P)H-hydrate dehydratase/NAD(P)H-hydrate epimerase [Cytophagales bacterium]|nr:bifunctional ADP-dependent NAD(P)H-hydrate dehydratase/NAD(P)H-hydrate epimerase [Cytophagales bacterium]HAA18982.1 bifunctional ADP-dependent NAD(P)H-hydrate dehydratase/NAD(P)H-hydrate epimerase [Cytophagales bacterium]HAP64799.1 bifunctional ADP-dependent NAD(P)H-hydrate dehydratase/NAD(P)H-hydrate epimerase [Cytophagales bacterium]
MKILSAEQIRQADAYTIRQEPITSIDLMERASRAFTVAFQQLFDSSHPVNVVAGTGNNGGDGLAVARMLLREGYSVSIFVINPDNKKGSEDFSTNLRRLADLQGFQMVRNEAQLPKFKEGTVIIDALFGSGLSRPITGLFAQAITAINASKTRRVAVDIASGLFADQPSAPESPIVCADHTFTFQQPKLAFFFAENDAFVGSWKVLDIHLHPDFIRRETSNYFSVESPLLKGWIPPRNKHAHKGSFGRALFVGGSYGKIGAAILACSAAMRAGTGLLTAHLPKCGYVPMQTRVPEAMVTTSDGEKFITDLPSLEGYTGIGVGPGLGQDPTSIPMLHQLLEQANCPLVLDADALNTIGECRELLEVIPRNSILTPHPKELSRLTGLENRGWGQLDTARSFARRYGVVLVVKGAHTATCLPDGRVFFNTTGNPGMATAGSGDVLTGIILGLLAQGINAARAAVLGVYLHGLAGNIAAHSQGEISLVASDIIEMMGLAYQKITQ